MYGLIKGPEAIPYRRAARPAAEAAPTRTDGDPDDAEDMMLMGLPFYRSQAGWRRKLAPIGLAVLALVVLGAVWWSLRSDREPAKSRNGERVAENTSGNSSTVTPKPATTTAQPTKPESHETSPTNKPPDKVVDDPMTQPKPAPVETADQKKPDTPAPTTPPTTAPTPPKPSDSPPAAKGERKVVGKHVANTSNEPAILLQRAAGQTAWQRVNADAAINSEDELLSLPGCRSHVHLASGVNASLWGTFPGDGSPVALFESASTLHSAPEFDADVTLGRGRISMANTKSNPARVRVRFHTEVWELALEPAAEVAIEVSGAPVYGFVKEPDKATAPQAFVAIFVLKGTAELKVQSRSHLMREPPGPAMFFWSNSGGASPGPQSLATVPAWAGSRTPPARTNQLLDNLGSRLRSGTPPDEVITEFAKESDPPSQRLGILCLAAIGKLPTLLDALADERSADARRAAIESLRHWIGQRASNDHELYTALEKKYRGGPAEIIMNLLHGFSPEQRSKPETYEHLIEYLKSDKLPIRELAWMHLLLMPETQEIAKTIPFDPAGGVDQRSAAYSRWKELVPDGKMPSKAPPTTPGGAKKK